MYHAHSFGVAGIPITGKDADICHAEDDRDGYAAPEGPFFSQPHEG
jgi:hypothetical protein